MSNLADPSRTNDTMTNFGMLENVATTWMLVNGSAKLDSAELDQNILAPFDKHAPPGGPPDMTHQFNVNQTEIVTWVINGHPYSEPQRPLVYGNSSDGWGAATTLRMLENSTIDLIMRVANDSMDKVCRNRFL